MTASECACRPRLQQFTALGIRLKSRSSGNATEAYGRSLSAFFASPLPLRLPLNALEKLRNSLFRSCTSSSGGVRHQPQLQPDIEKNSCSFRDDLREMSPRKGANPETLSMSTVRRFHEEFSPRWFFNRTLFHGERRLSLSKLSQDAKKLNVLRACRPVNGFQARLGFVGRFTAVAHCED